MGKKEDWREDLEREFGKLKWIANVEKDDINVNVKGYSVGPPKAADQDSAEELDETGVVGIYVRVRKEKKPR
jgi:hypothetical protein